jgi:D-alanyl-D-alanine carboxypeptidase
METIAPRSLTVARSFGYGLGLLRTQTPCGSAWGHSGASPGYVAEALASRDGRRQVVVLVNATGSLSGAGFFGLPKRAADALDHLVATAYCS